MNREFDVRLESVLGRRVLDEVVLPPTLKNDRLVNPSSFSFFFFVKCFWRTLTHVLLWGPLVPLFWISGDVSCGFQSQSRFWLIHFCRGECNAYTLRSTSGATPAGPLTASITFSHFPTCISRGGSWFRFERAISRTEDENAGSSSPLITLQSNRLPVWRESLSILGLVHTGQIYFVHISM